MRFLRTTTTQRLLAVLLGAAVAIVAGAAIAIAATSSGHKPPAKPLAQAIHDSLAGPSVPGISARVTLTNHLIDTGSFQGSDPLLSGASGRMWLSPGHGLRLELQSQNGTDAQVVVNQRAFSAYDPTTNTLYEGTLPADTGSGDASSKPDARSGLPTVTQIRSALAGLAGKLKVSSAIPGVLAGRGEYTVRLAPAASGGLLDRVEVSWDASRGVPLSLGVFAKGVSGPVLSLAASQISYTQVKASVFSIRAPAGAKVVTVTVPSSAGAAARSTHKKAGKHTEITGAGSVQTHLGFTLDHPATAGALSLSSVRLLGNGSHAGALLSYGSGLSGVYVIERSAAGQKAATLAAPSGDHAGFTLPTVSLRGGASGQELDTALGSVLTFTRGGVSFTVLGSVKPETVRGVARSL